MSSSKSEADTAEERVKTMTAKDNLRSFIKNSLCTSQLQDLILEIKETILLADTNNFFWLEAPNKNKPPQENRRRLDVTRIVYLSYSPFKSTPAFGTNDASNVEPSGSSEVPGRKGTDIE